ncbi:MAG: T9SS type A sorting domain-containing protein [Bacteroidia bacterium]
MKDLIKFIWLFGVFGMNVTGLNALNARYHTDPPARKFKLFIEGGIFNADHTCASVFNGKGKFICSAKLNRVNFFEIDISGFPKGIYSVKVNDGKKNYTTKMVVE